MAIVRLRNADRSFEIQGNETLLEAAIREGVGLPYGCSAGNCGLCRARLIEGELKPTRHHDFVFTQAERAHGDFLMCSNGAQSDLTLEVVLEKDPTSIPWQTLQAKVKIAEKLGERLLWLKLRVPRSQRLRFMAGQYA
ncbi:MAG: 2Fe-2S iron-sulfur cluster-binding protein, partial [Gammaproteobacteria bacterium]|nr:2Fe-2S iron-sulfur cluster-binding protein [Gammaproteobacteria bacterium]